jgi:two-component system response regulator PilR (NtrC family)
VDVRIISATHKDLAAEVQAGRFRQDLYYRLNVIQILVPPLRERRDDLPALCATLLRRIALESGIPVPTLSPAVLDQLALDPLHGNVRELENLLHRAVALSEENELQFEPSMPQSLNQETVNTYVAGTVQNDFQDSLPSDLQSYLDGTERAILIKALRETGFNRTSAAARLGLSLRQMRYRIARLRIVTPGSVDGTDELV